MLTIASVVVIRIVGWPSPVTSATTSRNSQLRLFFSWFSAIACSVACFLDLLSRWPIPSAFVSLLLCSELSETPYSWIGQRLPVRGDAGPTEVQLQSAIVLLSSHICIAFVSLTWNVFVQYIDAKKHRDKIQKNTVLAQQGFSSPNFEVLSVAMELPMFTSKKP